MNVVLEEHDGFGGPYYDVVSKEQCIIWNGLLTVMQYGDGTFGIMLAQEVLNLFAWKITTDNLMVRRFTGFHERE